jgi:hypothetical protein
MSVQTTEYIGKYILGILLIVGFVQTLFFGCSCFIVQLTGSICIGSQLSRQSL